MNSQTEFKQRSEQSIKKKRTLLLSPEKTGNKEDDQQEDNQKLAYVIREVDDQWYLCKQGDSIPYSQIKFFSEVKGQNELEIIEKFQKQNYEEFQFISVYDYFSFLFKDVSEKKIIYTELNIYKEDSGLARYMIAVFDNDIQTIKNILSAKENLISLLFSSLESILANKLQKAVEHALQALYIQGFSSEYDGYLISPKLTGLSLLIGLLDLYEIGSKELQDIFTFINQDLLFNGENLNFYIQTFINSQDPPQEVLYIQNSQGAGSLFEDGEPLIKEVDEEDNYEEEEEIEQKLKQQSNSKQKKKQNAQNSSSSRKQQISNKKQQDQQRQQDQQQFEADQLQIRILLLEKIIKRLEEVCSKKQSKYSEKLLKDFANYKKQISRIEKDEFQFTDANLYNELIFNKGQNPSLIWEKLKIKIQDAIPLSQREQDEWRRIAYHEFYLQAVKLLSLKALQENDLKTCQSCLRILYCLGYNKLQQILFYIEIYYENYSDAYVIASRMFDIQIFEKQALCLIKQNKLDECYQLIIDNFVNIQQQQTQNSQNANKIVETAQQNSKEDEQELPSQTLSVINLNCLYYLQRVLGQFGQEYVEFIGNFLIYEIFNTEKQDENVILKYYILAKQFADGVILEGDKKKAKKILEFVLQLESANNADKILKFFISRKIQQLSSTTFQSTYQQENSKINKKNSQNQSQIQKKQFQTQSQTPQQLNLKGTIQDKILEIIEIDKKFIRKQCEQYLNLIEEIDQKNKNNNTQLSNKQVELHKFLLQIGKTILFQEDSLYKIKYITFNEEKIMRKNFQNASIISDYRSPIQNQITKLVKPAITVSEAEINAYNDLSTEMKDLLKKIVFNQQQQQEKLTSDGNINENSYTEQNQKNKQNNVVQEEDYSFFNISANEETGIICRGIFINNIFPSFQISNLEFDPVKNLGFFNENQQMFSAFELNEDISKLEKFENLIKYASPYCLNAYGFFQLSEAKQYLLCEPYYENLFVYIQVLNKHSQQQKSIRDQEQQQQSQKIFKQQQKEFEKSLRESEVKYSQEMNQLKKQQQQQKPSEQEQIQKPENQDKDIINNQAEVQSEGNVEDKRQDFDEENNNNNKNTKKDSQQNIVTPFILDEITIITELVAILAGMQMDNISGFYSLYPSQIFYLTHKGELRVPNFIVLQFRSYSLTTEYFALAPELMNRNSNENYGIKSDIWALGAILYKIFWGKSFIDENSQNIEQQLLQFKKSATVESILAEERQPVFSFNQQDLQNQEQFLNFLQDIIRKCLIFHAESRPSALEILLDIHIYLKQQNINNKGIFALFGKNEVNNYLYSLDNLIFLEQQQSNNTGSEQQQQQTVQQSQKLIERSLSQLKISGNSPENKKSNNNFFNSSNNNANNTTLQKNQADNNDQSTASLNQQNKNIKRAQSSQQKQRDKQKPGQSIQEEMKIENNANQQKNNENNNNQQNQQNQQKRQIFILGGGSCLINYQNGIVIYCTPFNKTLILNNINLRKNQSISTMSLNEIVQGNGILQMRDPIRQVIGNFGSKGQISKTMMIDMYLRRKIALTFDELKIPKGETEEKLIEDPINKNNFMEDQGLLKKYCSVVQECQNDKQFIDFFGSCVKTNFDSSLGSIIFNTEHEPFYMEDSNKCLLLIKNKGFILDFQTLTYTVYYDVLNSEDHNVNIQQIFEKLANINLIKQHLLSGMKYIGTMKKWKQDEGRLYYQFSNTILIKNKPEIDQLYFTKINYQNNDFYEGTILNGMYHGEGLYGSKNQKIFEGYFENDVFQEGSIYYYGPDTPYVKFIGQVFQDVEKGSYLRNGEGKLFYKNGDQYEGSFVNDKFHGQGLYKFDAGRLGFYKGEFQIGMRDGQGVLKDVKGHIYEGQFKNNKKQGFGKEEQENIEIYEGEFLANKRDGVGIVTYLQGEVFQYEGGFKEGKKHGEGVERMRDGKKYQVKYYKDQSIRRNFIGTEKKVEEQRKKEQRIPYKTYSFF